MGVCSNLYRISRTLRYRRQGRDVY